MKKLFLLFFPVILVLLFTIPFFIKSPSYADVCKYVINEGTSCSTVGNGIYTCTYDVVHGYVGSYKACATGATCHGNSGNGGGGGAVCLYSCGDQNYTPHSICASGTSPCGSGVAANYPVTRSDAYCSGQTCCQNPSGGSCNSSTCGGQFCTSDCHLWTTSYCYSSSTCSQSGTDTGENVGICGQYYNCPQPAVNGVCGTTHYNCGDPSNYLPWPGSEYATNWQWWCYSSNGGSNSNLCVENKPSCDTDTSGCSGATCNGVCGVGTKSCTYTTSSGGSACIPQSYTQSCPLPACTYNVTAHVFIDKNGSHDPTGQPAYTGSLAGITSSAGGSPNPGNGYTDATGTIVFSTVPQGSDTITLATVPANYLVSGSNSTTVSGPPDANAYLGIVPLNSISGFVYNDGDRSRSYSSSKDSIYTAQSLPIQVCMGASCNTYHTDGSGNFTTGVTFPPGTYTVSLSGLPQLNGQTDKSYAYSGNSSYQVTLGSPCSPAAEASSSCSGNNVIGVSFGITNSHIWIQSVGGDIYQAGNFQFSTIPDNACGGGGAYDYMSIPSPAAIASPGIIYSEAASADFDFGEGSASPSNWFVAGSSVNFQVRTSYASVNTLVGQSNSTLIPLANVCGGGGLNNCSLPSGLASGVYTVDLGSNGTLNLNAANNTFTNGDYVIMVAGSGTAKLTIKTNILVPAGNTLLLTSQTDIHVDKAVGVTSATSNNTADTNANLEGYYSTDKSFIVDGNTADGTSCAINNPDLRLNLQGAIVTNAVLLPAGGGKLQINRDMCEEDVCPTLSVRARPDYVLNAPLLYQPSKRFMQEVAP